MRMADPYQSCSVCRFMRSLVFSVIGGGLAGYGSLSLGLERSEAIIAAFFGALGAVVWISRRRRGED
jgi:hypothetical protein